MLSRLKISQKLTAAFGVLIAIILVANAAVLWKLLEVKGEAAANGRAYARSMEVQDIYRGLVEQQNVLRAFSIAANPSYIETYREQSEIIDKSLESFIAQTTSPDQKARGEKLRQQYAAWRADIAEKSIALASDPATRDQARELSGRRTLKPLRVTLDELEKAQDARQAQRLEDIRKGIILSLVIFTGSSLSAVAAAIVMSVTLSRAIASPVRAMTDAMGKLASGDNTVEIPARDRKDEIGAMAGAVQVFKDAAIEKLRLEGMTAEQAKAAEEERARNEAAKAKAAREQQQVVDSIATGLTKLSAGDLVFRINEAFAPEYEKLRADFNGAMEQLQETMKVINGATQGIRSGTDEISQAADDLSKRTEQQAASLEETAAALDEITATVRKTAEGANHARDVVSTAKGDAEHSGQVVRNAVAAMSEIEKSAQQISQIIGVIDEIAFQTNLLALNAGVEAARAGDAGKGFAVVASEVRALAQRSADAAKEIKTLISASTQQVGQGVTLVGETGQALERIVTQVAEITNIVSEIAASAQEQATGLNQVNTAVNQMDQVTQQNAAMVEESTAASHSLAQETEELARLISRFQVGETAAAQRLAARQPARRAAPAPTPRQANAPAPAMKTVSTHSGGGGALLKPQAQAAPETDSWEEF
ncbi:methyl-accepting chemotaxis protein [Phenylobacterium sp. VNQ135]|uniref:methyl-accepting chemotaxis protein n=1 Tax=Phenylobacterium sp. VNQ135 TaxID=3400922 RepID=UPI003C0BA7B6